MSVYLSMCICILHMCKYPWVPEKGTGFPRTGVTGGCELPDRGAGDPLLTVEPYLQPLHVAFLRQGLSLTLKFILLARPAGQQALGICLFLTPRCVGLHTCTLVPPTFVWA